MKKLYEQFFRIPEKGKISRRVMLTRAFTTAMCMILCLCAFCLGTHAYYTCTVSSEANTIQSATFTVNATVAADQGGTAVAALLSDDPDDTAVDSAADDTAADPDAGAVSAASQNTFMLSTGGYTVTLTPTGNATTGYCVIYARNCTAECPADCEEHLNYLYRTEQIGTEDFTFTLNATGNIEIVILAYWGTPPATNLLALEAPAADVIVAGATIEIVGNSEPVEEELTEEEEEATEEENTEEDEDPGEEESDENPGDTQGEGEGEPAETPDDSSDTDDTSNGDDENAVESTGDDSNSGTDDPSDSNAETGSTGTEEGSSTDDIPDASSESVTDNADTASTETTQTDATASVETSSDTGEESPSV